MIPPVEVRQNRPCIECICNWECAYANGPGEISSDCRDDMDVPMPCKYHMTADEYKKLVDSGVIK